MFLHRVSFNLKTYLVLEGICYMYMYICKKALTSNTLVLIFPEDGNIVVEICVVLNEVFGVGLEALLFYPIHQEDLTKKFKCFVRKNIFISKNLVKYGFPLDNKDKKQEENLFLTKIA